MERVQSCQTRDQSHKKRIWGREGRQDPVRAANLSETLKQDTNASVPVASLRIPT